MNQILKIIVGLMFSTNVLAFNFGVASSNQTEISSVPGVNVGVGFGNYLLTSSSFGVANRVYYSNQYTFSGYYWSEFGQGIGDIWLGVGLGGYYLKKGILQGGVFAVSSAEGIGPAVKISWFPFSKWVSISFESLYGVNRFFYFNSWSTVGFAALEFSI